MIGKRSKGNRQDFGTPHSHDGWRSDSHMAREKMTPASWIAHGARGQTMAQAGKQGETPTVQAAGARHAR
jgi:hypothetical protein